LWLPPIKTRWIKTQNLFRQDMCIFSLHFKLVNCFLHPMLLHSFSCVVYFSLLCIPNFIIFLIILLLMFTIYIYWVHLICGQCRYLEACGSSKCHMVVMNNPQLALTKTQIAKLLVPNPNYATWNLYISKVQLPMMMNHLSLNSTKCKFQHVICNKMYRNKICQKIKF